MDYIALTKKIEELYKVISEIESDAQSAFASNKIFASRKLSQEDYDFSCIYGDLIEILIPMLDLYPIIMQSKYNLIAEKVYYVAICEMIKQDYNRGMLITFRAVTGIADINTNRYYDLLQKVSDSHGLTIKKVNGRRQFEEAYILETGIPKNLTKYVIRMFRIYWRYFRNYSVDERLAIVHDYLKGNDLQDEYILDQNDAKLFESYRDYLKVFPEKATRIFDKLDLIFRALDDYSGELSMDNQQIFSEEISKQVGFDISSVLRDTDLTNIYFTYLKQIPIGKFQKILNNLPKNEYVITPDGTHIQASRLISSSIICGIYLIRGNNYFVVIDPNISLEDMLSFDCDRVITLANDYYCYISRKNFYVECNGNELSTRKMNYKSQFRFLWFGKLQPASCVVVDGHTIMSSESTRHSARINKYFDYDKKESRLQLTIGNVRVNDPLKPYGKLYYSLNGGEKKLLAVGNSKGLYYRDNIHENIAGIAECNIEYWLNDEKIFEDELVHKKLYVFDKWNGTEYLMMSNNDKHSGSLVVFSLKNLIFDENLEIERNYVDGKYYVYELRVKRSEASITIGDCDYLFERANKPTIFIKSENGEISLFDDVSDLLIKILNLGCESVYRLTIENAAGNWSEPIKNGEYHIRDFIQDKDKYSTGKWNIGLWKKQEKIDDIEFSLVPRLQIEPEQKNILEGKDVIVKIRASEPCFISETGEFDCCTSVNIGPAILDESGDKILAREIEHYVYLDSIGVSRRVVLTPEVWGVRTQDEHRVEWSREKNIILNMHKISKTKIAIFSTGDLTAYINDMAHSFVCGKTELNYLPLLGQIKRKSEIVISDDRSTEKIVVACNPDCKFLELVVDKSIEVVLEYAGPEMQNLQIRTFIDGLKHTQIERKLCKSRMLLYIPIGETNQLNGKRISVDVCTSISGIPTKLFDQIIEIEELSSNKTISIDNSDGFILNKLSDYANARSLMDYYFTKDRTLKKIDFNAVVNWIREVN